MPYLTFYLYFLIKLVEFLMPEEDLAPRVGSSLEFP